MVDAVTAGIRGGLKGILAAGACCFFVPAMPLLPYMFLRGAIEASRNVAAVHNNPNGHPPDQKAQGKAEVQAQAQAVRPAVQANSTYEEASEVASA